MNTNGNTYTFIYASVMVVVVAAMLAFASESLKPYQEKNVRIEKMQNILSSLSIESTPENAEELFNKYMPENQHVVIDSKGEPVSGENAFDINLKEELEKDLESRHMPLFIASFEDGSQKIVIPVLGKGLWGPIWGYISLEKDMNTIAGAVFAHKGETPGLGADIDQKWFQEPFKGKKLFDEAGTFIGIKVHKGGKGAAAAMGDTEHGVDAISGGTITSKGLEAMLLNCLSGYETYFKNNKK